MGLPMTPEDATPYIEVVPGSIYIPAELFEPVCCRFCRAEFANIDWISGHFVKCPARFPGRSRA